MTGSIPLAPRFRLKDHHLRQVLCQIQFSPVLRLREEGGADNFQELIRRSYPRYSHAAGVGFIVSPQGLQVQQAGSPLHRFLGPGGFSATLATDFIALETTSYDRFEEFADRLAELARGVAQVFEPPEMPRIGLRFINEFRLSQDRALDEARGMLRPSLLGPLTDSVLDGAVANSEQVLDLRRHQGGLLVRHGLHFEGGTTVQPSPGASMQAQTADLAKPFYLLDLDAYDDTPLPFDPRVAYEKVLAFNEDIRSFFAWAVTERYRREELGQEDAP